MDRLNSLWGEMPDEVPEKARLSQSDKDALSRMPRPLMLEGPRIHQPAPALFASSCVHADGGYVAHGTRVLAHLAELRRKCDSGQADTLPAMPTLELPAASPADLGPFSPRESPKTAYGCPPLPNITGRAARKAAKRAVALLCAFHGFDLAEGQALDILTDAALGRLDRICRLVRAARDKELSTKSKCGFADPVCRAYEEIGLGSILNIGSYYKDVIMARYKAIVGLVESTHAEIRRLDEAPAYSADNPSAEDNIPEIHFPSSDEAESGPPTLSLDHNAPQIETGLQMLQSLEQGAYGNLDGSQASNSQAATPPPPSAHSGIGDDDNMQQPMSHDSNAALLLATVSPGSAIGNRKRRRTSDKMPFY